MKMTKRAKLLITAAVLAGLSGLAIPTLAAQTGASTGAAVQTAFGGPDAGRGADDGPWHHHPVGFGPGGPDRGGPGGPGAMGMSFGPPGGARLEALLEKFDTNKDGKISRAQIDTVLADQFKKYDTDGDGTLSLTEYQALFNDEMHEAMVRSFQALDRTGDGKVTLDEFEQPIHRLVQHLDRNGTGVIDLNNLGDRRMDPDHARDRNGPPAPPPGPQQDGG
jgi:Ca2+-binding EF-hand superfamily protein